MIYVKQKRTSNLCLVSCLLMLQKEFELSEQKIWEPYFYKHLSFYSPYGISQNFNNLSCIECYCLENIPTPFILNFSPPGIISHFIVIKLINKFHKTAIVNDPLGVYPYTQIKSGEHIEYTLDFLCSSRCLCFAVVPQLEKLNYCFIKSYAIEDLSRGISFRLYNNYYALCQILRSIEVPNKFKLLNKDDGIKIMRQIYENEKLQQYSYI